MFNGEKNFIFHGSDTVKLANKYGTPLYVVSEDHIIDRCTEIKESFLNKYENTRAVYASKAFLTKEMCKIVSREGIGIDVVSGGEIYTAMKAGFPMENVIFHGNNKTIDEIELGIETNVGRFVVDNLYELELLNALAAEKNKVMNILFRITPGVDSYTHEYISTGQVDSKFGIPLKEEILFEAINMAMDMEYINLLGFHFHVGSQLFENTSHLMALDILLELIRNVGEKVEFETKELNVGGGFGIRYTKEDNPKPLSYFIDPIMERIQDKCEEFNLERPKIIIEPGRWIIGEAGITLYTIGGIKEIPNVRTYIGIDGGLPDNPRPALYRASYDGVVANRMDEELVNKVTIAGKCCESGDILIRDLEVPEIEPGDILAVKSTGAYNYSMASNYNMIPRPPVVMIKDGVDRLVIRRETYDDILSREVI
ncbi:MAG: diaminopimelate decarboxylase [Anaeromicrobium sp.]|jgi:diaminopimelate decarboxylase|uniref:diaminopimelate decarboxylase n=1 Tax=Anaeromicrobium sp. TaxID=1929132 RepID=UPI0025E52365|nr:diaminopimelate decarboxylase [Anaeromicrobium sp.]MCT4594169.1 diaminopimelate decarboxylase [Anaeromicrobium sp.]